MRFNKSFNGKQDRPDWKKGSGAAWGKGLAVVSLASVCILGGCAGNQKEPAVQTTEASTGAESSAPQESESASEANIPNPMEEVKDALDFELIGVHMILPNGAEKPVYHIISGQVADAQFTVNGVHYTYRGSDTAEDFAGIFERFKDEVISQNFEYDDGSVEIQIKTTESGGRLASWQWGSTRYTLYTASEVSDDDITNLTMELVELSQNEK